MDREGEREGGGFTVYLYAQRGTIPTVHVQGVRDYPTSRASNFSWSLENR